MSLAAESKYEQEHRPGRRLVRASLFAAVDTSTPLSVTASGAAGSAAGALLRSTTHSDRVASLRDAERSCGHQMLFLPLHNESDSDRTSQSRARCGTWYGRH